MSAEHLASKHTIDSYWDKLVNHSLSEDRSCRKKSGEEKELHDDEIYCDEFFDERLQNVGFEMRRLFNKALRSR